MNEIAMFWWWVALALLIVEIITPITVFIFPAVIAGLVGVLALFMPVFWIQALIFFVFSGILIAWLRPLLIKSEKKSYTQGADAFLNQKVLVVEEINNDKEKGRVKYQGNFYPARSFNKEVISENQHVIVREVQGITLIVSKNETKEI